MGTKSFIEIQKDSIEREFWDENSKNTILYQLESTYKKEIIRDYGICEIVNHGDKFLLKMVQKINTIE